MNVQNGIIVLLEATAIDTQNRMYGAMIIFAIATITAFLSLPVILILYGFYYLIIKGVSMPNMEYGRQYFYQFMY